MEKDRNPKRTTRLLKNRCPSISRKRPRNTEIAHATWSHVDSIASKKEQPSLELKPSHYYIDLMSGEQLTKASAIGMLISSVEMTAIGQDRSICRRGSQASHNHSNDSSGSFIVGKPHLGRRSPVIIHLTLYTW